MKCKFALVLLGMFVFLACMPVSTPTIVPSTTLLPTSTPALTATPTSTPAPTATAIPTATPSKGVQNPDNGHWYLVLPQMGWDNAKNYCTLHGGYLVTLEDNAENMFVYNLAPNSLLGATDKDDEGHWVWATGEEVKYTTWCTGEPNNCGSYEIYGTCMPENYITYHNDNRCHPGQWNDVSGGEEGEGNYVCEFEN